MDPISTLILNVGTGILANFSYDQLKHNINKDRLETLIHNEIKLVNARVSTKDVITLMAERGLITMEGTNIKAGKSLQIGSKGTGQSVIGSNSSVQGGGASIDCGQGASVSMTGSASIVLGNDQIDFKV